MELNNRLKNEFKIEDFTLNEYRNLLKISKKKYKFIFYNDRLSNEKFILWRHDLDLSINRAYELAKIENRKYQTLSYYGFTKEELADVIK